MTKEEKLLLWNKFLDQVIKKLPKTETHIFRGDRVRMSAGIQSVREQAQESFERNLNWWLSQGWKIIGDTDKYEKTLTMERTDEEIEKDYQEKVTHKQKLMELNKPHLNPRYPDWTNLLNN